MTLTEIDAALAVCEKAHNMVSDLCHQRRKWIMSVPARRDYDPDLVIGDGLRAGESALRALREQQQKVFELHDALAKGFGVEDGGIWEDRAMAAESALREFAPVRDEILRIMETYREQEAKGCVDTPGGLEHMGDVWRLFMKWERLLKPAPPVAEEESHAND